MKLKKNLVLTGMMGVGKSTVGKSLANKLSFKFKDIDKIIEIKEGCTIDIIFKKDSDKITLESDKEQISRVFLNLIKNSIESINQKAQNNNNFTKKIAIELTEDNLSLIHI